MGVDQVLGRKQKSVRLVVGSSIDKQAKRVRIAVLNSHPIQYFGPLYAYLNQAPDLEVTALYLSDFSVRGAKDSEFGREVKWDIDVLTGYPPVFVGEAAHKREVGGFWSLIAPQLWSELRSGRYDVLWTHGHGYAANFVAIAAAKSIGMPVMMRGETHLGLSRAKGKAILRRPLMGTLYGQCDRLLAIGSENHRFYRAMGVPEEKIFLVPYAVDNRRFMRDSNLDPSERLAVRQKYGVEGDLPAILFAAKFTERKRPLDVLRAALRLKEDHSRKFSLIMVGSGELESSLRAFCEQNRLDNVVFPGFVNQSELPRIYGASDIFVLPSEQEPWGLAVNEAMCAGLPIVVAAEVGCAPDLVQAGFNGYTPQAGDVAALADAFATLIDDPLLRREFGRNSLRRIESWGYQECLDGIRLAIADLPLRAHPLAALAHS